MRPMDLLILSSLVICGLSYIFYRNYVKRDLERKINNAKRSKLKTMELLEERGFEIVDCDRSLELCSKIDGKTYTDILSIDFIVQKGRERYLVRVSSGGQSSRLGYRENRGTLIGVSAIFRYPNLLLVDPERRIIRLMKTVVKEPFYNKLLRLKKTMCIFVLGAVCAIIVEYYFF